MKKGFLVDGKYKIIDTLGKGGMSTVYLAENIKLGTLWAVKEISKVSGSKVDFHVEPNILKKLNHPALPRIFDIVEDDEFVYIIVDYIEGNSLDKELDRFGCIAEETVLVWAKQLCEVLVYLHGFRPNPIIYRDMKPSNIILCSDGSVKLIDFGIAREYKEDSEYDTVYIGTRGYAAPEQFGYGQTNVTTDIYSLGITLLHIVTGHNPEYMSGGIESAESYSGKLSYKMERIISRCIKHDPEERYQSVKEVLSDIEAIIYINKTQHGSDLKLPYTVKVPEDYKKTVGLAGDRASGTTLLTIAISELFGSIGRKTSIIDLTKNCKLYKIFGWENTAEPNEMCDRSKNSWLCLIHGSMEPLKPDKYRNVYTSGAYAPIDRERYLELMERVRGESDIVLIDMDFETDTEIIRYLDQLYIVKDMDMYNIECTSGYLSLLAKQGINLSKVRLILNKYTDSSIKAKAIIDTIVSNSFSEKREYANPFNYERPRYYTVPFDMENYVQAIESINHSRFTCARFTQNFKKAIQEIAKDIYPIRDKCKNRILDIFFGLKETGKDAF
ncbi:MAG: serine/threonine-protein kinase [Clostridia bacterium]|nr:serine/threonine-protein kinase [Clostridia bacterium]